MGQREYGDLPGREKEQDAIAGLLSAAREGTSGVLVLRGEPGIGKTALLDHAARTARAARTAPTARPARPARPGHGTEVEAGAEEPERTESSEPAAGGLRILHGTGIEHEAELPFAGLQLLLRPALDVLPRLPVPQREALEAVFGLRPGAPESMLVGLATLSLLAEHASPPGLLCLVDDAHWLDRSSRDILVFAARRLHAEGVAMLFAARDGEGTFEAPGLPELRLTGLPPEAAAAVLDRHPLPPALRYRMLTEAGGNPLALRELPLALAAEGPVAGAVFHPGALPLTSRLQLTFHGQVSRLPGATQTLLLVIAADETGELSVILRAAAELGTDVPDLTPAEAAGLVVRGDEGGVIRFRHPLIRAAVYQRAPLAQRLEVHRALATALAAGPDTGPHAAPYADRRAWHLAAATTGTDDEAADALEHTAERARERAGHQAASAAYTRAAQLTAAPADRSRRLALAAESALAAGDMDRARHLANHASGRNDSTLRARITHIKALAAFWHGTFPVAHRLLLDGAELSRETDPREAAAMLAQAVHTGWYLGEQSVAEVVARLTALTLPDTEPMAPAVRYLVEHLGPDGGDGHAPVGLTQTLAAVRARGEIPEQTLMLLCGTALTRGQDADAYALASRIAERHRADGGAGRLPTVLFFVAEAEIFTGRLREALTTVSEALGLARDTGQRQWVGQFSSALAHLHAAAGEEEACRRQAEAGFEGATPEAIAPGAPWAHWALGLLELGYGRAESALTELVQLTREPMRHHLCALRSTPDLVEAAVRAGAPERAAEPLARFERWSEAVGRPWAQALVLRCRALLGAGRGGVPGSAGPSGSSEPVEPMEGPGELYAAALAAHEPEGRPVEYARTALLYGEWLRRARRKAEARAQLSAALGVFERLGMRPWAERARAELTATGTPVTAGAASRDAATRGAVAGLTPQETQIIRLAATGLSNRDIAAQLFLSHRTVGYHLYKAYPKLGIASRTELKSLAGELDL